MSKLDDAIERGGGRPLFGIACNTYNPVMVEIAAMVGYDALWIEMEHTHVSFMEAADLCRVASALGLLTMIRIPDSRRENVLKAAECGPDIIDLPMANSPEPAQELVRHARYAPEGQRGFFGGSRAVRYTLCDPIAEEQKRINRELCLMVQIETREAADRADEICAVAGLNAILLGPGDMSASFGVPGETNHPAVQDAMERAVNSAKRQGRRVAMACGPASVSQWAQKGVELFFVGGDIACLKLGAKSLLAEARGDA